MVDRRTLSRWLLLAAALLPARPAAAGDDAAALATARAALARDDATAAAAAYARIEPGSPLWPDRLEDAMRWHLLHRRPGEAWRLTELARRLGVTFATLDYARVLAELRSHVCVLGRTRGPVAWQRLEDAHIYRYASRFQPAGYDANPYDDAANGRLEHHLAEEQTHALADIPTAVLLPGTGCPFLSERFAERTTARRYEKAALLAWYNLETAGDPDAALPGAPTVELRLLDLASDAKSEDKDQDQILARRILMPFTKYGVKEWLAVPDPERRYLWQRLIDAGLLPKPPYKNGTPEAGVVKSVVLGLETPDAATWMGLLELSSLPADERRRLFDHLLTIDQVPNRPYLLAEEAGLAYRRGDVPAALMYTRQLLVLGADEGDDQVDRYAMALATQIFTEYHYDEAMLGALQNSLPAAAWGALFRRLLIQQALVGDADGFAATRRAAAGRQEHALRLDAAETACLTALALRHAAAFEQVLRGWEQSQSGGHWTQLLAEVGEGVLQLAPAERQRVQPYLERLAAFLKARMTRGAAPARLSELMALFSGAESAYAKGRETTRGGTVKAGVIDLTETRSLPDPFTWEAPAHLPLRDLLAQPAAATDRAWVIQ